jgi:predicted AAA+ superfamily ATPase
MPHLRKRIVEKSFRKAASWSPIVGLLGMRQVGKTTLLKTFAKPLATFDEPATVERFARQSSSLLREGPFPMLFDEVQKFPPFFDSLKAAVDERPIPGRYFITGSVRFSDKKQIRESLTGRIALLELYPLTVSECNEGKHPSFLPTLAQKWGKKTTKNGPGKVETKIESIFQCLEDLGGSSRKQLLDYLISGGMPGICFKRDPSIRNDQWSNHIDTLFSRDIQILVNTRVSPQKLRQIYQSVCLKQGEPLRHSELSREFNLSRPTIQNLLRAMEGIFLLRPHGKTLYAEDVGLSHFLCEGESQSARAPWLQLVYSELRAQLGYELRNEAELKEYRTEGGIVLPFVVGLKSGASIAFSIDIEDRPTEKSLKSITWFQKKYPNSLGVALHLGSRSAIVNSQCLSLPIERLF